MSDISDNGGLREMKTPRECYLYAHNVLGGRWETAEPVIATSAKYSFRYAKDVLKGRFELGEEAISKHAVYSMYYAHDVLRGRFELGESKIATSSEYSYYYAKYVLKDRFIEGEARIYRGRFADDYRGFLEKKENERIEQVEWQTDYDDHFSSSELPIVVTSSVEMRSGSSIFPINYEVHVPFDNPEGCIKEHFKDKLCRVDYEIEKTAREEWAGRVRITRVWSPENGIHLITRTSPEPFKEIIPAGGETVIADMSYGSEDDAARQTSTSNYFDVDGYKVILMMSWSLLVRQIRDFEKERADWKADYDDHFSSSDNFLKKCSENNDKYIDRVDFPEILSRTQEMYTLLSLDVFTRKLDMDGDLMSEEFFITVDNIMCTIIYHISGPINEKTGSALDVNGEGIDILAITVDEDVTCEHYNDRVHVLDTQSSIYPYDDDYNFEEWRVDVTEDFKEIYKIVDKDVIHKWDEYREERDEKEWIEWQADYDDHFSSSEFPIKIATSGINPKLIDDPYECYLYVMRDENEERVPECEPAISTSAHYSYNYSNFIIKGRWEMGEAAIATDPHHSYLYAKDVLLGRFPEGEETISKSVQWSCQYAIDVIRGRFELGEPIIATDGGVSYIYARFALHGRFELGEDAIAEDAKHSYEYAVDVIDGRFEKGEERMFASQAFFSATSYGDLYREFLNEKQLEEQREKEEWQADYDDHFSISDNKIVKESQGSKELEGQFLETMIPFTIRVSGSFARADYDAECRVVYSSLKLDSGGYVVQIREIWSPEDGIMGNGDDLICGGNLRIYPSPNKALEFHCKAITIVDDFSEISDKLHEAHINVVKNEEDRLREYEDAFGKSGVDFLKKWSENNLQVSYVEVPISLEIDNVVFHNERRRQSVHYDIPCIVGFHYEDGDMEIDSIIGPTTGLSSDGVIILGPSFQFYPPKDREYNGHRAVLLTGLSTIKTRVEHAQEREEADRREKENYDKEYDDHFSSSVNFLKKWSENNELPVDLDNYSAQECYSYAKDVIGGRFPEGEATIATSAVFSYLYAKDVLKGRFIEGEPVIATDAENAFDYAWSVLKGRFELAEPIIANSVTNAFQYARDIIKGRWKEGEGSISIDATLSRLYAIEVIHGRFPLGESAIEWDPEELEIYNNFLADLKKEKEEWQVDYDDHFSSTKSDNFIKKWSQVNGRTYTTNLTLGIWIQTMRSRRVLRKDCVIKYSIRDEKDRKYPEDNIIIEKIYLDGDIDIVHTNEDAEDIGVAAVTVPKGLELYDYKDDMVRNPPTNSVCSNIPFEKMRIIIETSRYMIERMIDSKHEKEQADYDREYEDAFGSSDKVIKEAQFLDSAEGCYSHAVNNLHGRYENGESTIAKSAEYSYAYAKDVLKGRFELGEKMIAIDPSVAWRYAEYVIKGRWEKGEEAIAQHPYTAYAYAKFVLHGRFKLGERAISTSAGDSYAYAADILHGRFELGEAAMAKSPDVLDIYNGFLEDLAKEKKEWQDDYDDHFSSNKFPIKIAVNDLPEQYLNDAKACYQHAMRIGYRRFPEGEPAIATSAQYSFQYAFHCLQGRFELGEDVISKHAGYSSAYAKDVIGGRWEMGEAVIATSPVYSLTYAEEVLNGRFPLGEAAIGTNDNFQGQYEELLERVKKEKIDWQDDYDDHFSSDSVDFLKVYGQTNITRSIDVPVTLYIDSILYPRLRCRVEYTRSSWDYESRDGDNYIVRRILAPNDGVNGNQGVFRNEEERTEGEILPSDLQIWPVPEGYPSTTFMSTDVIEYNGKSVIVVDAADVTIEHIKSEERISSVRQEEELRTKEPEEHQTDYDDHFSSSSKDIKTGQGDPDAIFRDSIQWELDFSLHYSNVRDGTGYIPLGKRPCFIEFEKSNEGNGEGVDINSITLEITDDIRTIIGKKIKIPNRLMPNPFNPHFDLWVHSDFQIDVGHGCQIALNDSGGFPVRNSYVDVTMYIRQVENEIAEHQYIRDTGSEEYKKDYDDHFSGDSNDSSLEKHGQIREPNQPAIWNDSMLGIGEEIITADLDLRVATRHSDLFFTQHPCKIVYMISPSSFPNEDEGRPDVDIINVVATELRNLWNLVLVPENSIIYPPVTSNDMVIVQDIPTELENIVLEQLEEIRSREELAVRQEMRKLNDERLDKERGDFEYNDSFGATEDKMEKTALQSRFTYLPLTVVIDGMAYEVNDCKVEYFAKQDSYFDMGVDIDLLNIWLPESGVWKDSIIRPEKILEGDIKLYPPEEGLGVKVITERGIHTSVYISNSWADITDNVKQKLQEEENALEEIKKEKEEWQTDYDDHFSSTKSDNFLKKYTEVNRELV